MPKSRSRRKPGKKTQATRSSPPAAGGLVQGKYDVGRVRSTESQIGGLLLGGHAPDLMVELLPALMWLEHAKGHPTNMCVAGSMTLHYAYAALGIVAQPRAVDLVVSDESTGNRTFYGRPEPYWSGTTFHGHCVLWLPGSRRFIDATVEQYPEVRRYRLGPICGPVAASTPQQQTFLSRGELPPGTQIGVKRKDLMLLYTAVEHRFDDVVIAGPIVRDNTAELQRSGHNLAAQAIMLLRRPEVIDRARQAPHPRVRVLLDLLVDVEPDVDENGNYRFVLPDAPSDAAPLRLDELPTAGQPPLPCMASRVGLTPTTPTVANVADTGHRHLPDSTASDDISRSHRGLRAFFRRR